jgi:hypothetical protein
MMNYRRFNLAVPLNAFTMLALCGCSGESGTGTMPPAATLDAEEQVVYREILAQKYPASFYVIQAETDPDGTPGDSSPPDQQVMASQVTICRDVRSETTSNYLERNDSAHPVAADMNLAVSYVLITDEELEQIFSGSSDGWQTFYARYPNAPGIIKLSRVGFDERMDQALVYVGHMFGGLGGEGGFYLLQKDGSAWAVVCERVSWIS